MSGGLPTIGKFQLLERLGRGATAEVFKAYNPQLERVVAIKVLHAHLAEAPDFTARFLREARVVALLQHPHIVQVFDFDTADERPYMVMEYVPGNSLKSRLDEAYTRAERLPLPEVLRIFRALLSAVGYAHAQGMIHRDLKPANILLDSNGRPVLTDFGIARLLGAAKLTASGVAVGTPAYMSPEQGQGQTADERSDLYALGIVLFECLTGSVPYEADSSVALLLKHIHQPVPVLTEARPDLPEALAMIVYRALAKNPDERYQSAAELWAALAALPEASMLAEGAAPLPPVPAPPRPVAVTEPEGTTSQPPVRVPAHRTGRQGLVVAAVVFAGLLVGGYVVARQATALSPAEQAVATADAWLAAGNAQLAADAYTSRLEADPRDVAALRGRAAAYEQLGQVVEALSDIETALALAPEAAFYYAERARLNAQYGLAAAPDVLADLDRAVELARPEEVARLRFLRGWAILNFALIDDRPNPEQALDDLVAAAALAADNAEYQFTLARALLAAQRTSEALPVANRAVELDPAAGVHHKLRAHIHFALGDLYAALDDLSAAIAREPSAEGGATLYAERAYVQYRLQRAPEAQADLAEAQRLSPTSPLARYTALVLNPDQPRAKTTDLAEAQAQAADDPIWQAIFNELLPASP